MIDSHTQHSAQSRYPILRSVTTNAWAELDDHGFENAFRDAFPDADIDAVEINLGNIGRSLGNIGRSVGRAAPGILSGAASGASMGAALGPYGMLAGAALGAIGGGIAHHNQNQRGNRNPRQPARPTPSQRSNQNPARRPAPRTMAPPRQIPRSTPPIAPNSPAGGIATGSTGTLAANQLLALLSRPEVLQAIMALSMGRSGREDIQVGEFLVTPQQIVEAVQLVGTVDGSQAHSLGESDPHYPTGFSASLMAEMAVSDPQSHPFAHAIAQLPPEQFEGDLWPMEGDEFEARYDDEFGSQSEVSYGY